MATSHTFPAATEPSQPNRPQLIVVPVPPVDSEHRRWLRLLGLDFAAGGAFFIALFATGMAWFLLGVLVCWPLAGALSLVYLAISSEANGSPEVPASPQTRADRRHGHERSSASQLPPSAIEASGLDASITVHPP